MIFEEYNDILTVEDVMEILNIGKHTAYSLLANDEIRAFKLGRAWKIPKANVQQYIVRSCFGQYNEEPPI